MRPKMDARSIPVQAVCPGWRIILLFALTANLLLAVTIGARDAPACSCAGDSTPEERLQAADAVFAGEVVDVEENFTPGPPGLHLGPVTFDVEEAWKGVSEDPVVVRGYGIEGEGSCGIGFGEGERYLVYAHRGGESGDGPLATSICEATKPLANAEADLRALGPAELALPEAAATEAVVSDPASSTQRDVAPVVAASAALLSLAAIGVLALRRRRRRSG